MNCSDAIRSLSKDLGSIYDPSEAAAIAEWVLEHLTGLKRSGRLLKKEEELSSMQLDKLESYRRRLLLHEPVQYVLNEAWFAGMRFFVNEEVLIPRPETEELVEWVISSLRFPLDELTIIDIGTGSGCIPVSLKRRLRKARVTGLDVSAGALAIARKNAADLNADVQFEQLDFLDTDTWSLLPHFDLITSNPPYIPLSGKKEMAPNVVNYEPHLALFVPDEDALVFYKALAAFAQTHLKKNGYLFAEIHEELAEPVQTVFRSAGFETVLKKDMQEKDRMIRVSWVNEQGNYSVR